MSALDRTKGEGGVYFVSILEAPGPGRVFARLASLACSSVQLATAHNIKFGNARTPLPTQT